jgi:hypothetical protein
VALDAKVLDASLLEHRSLEVLLAVLDQPPPDTSARLADLG